MLGDPVLHIVAKIFVVILYKIYYHVDPVAQSVQRLRYGLDGADSNPSGDEIFRPFRPVLGSTQPTVKWIPGLSRW